MDNHNPATRLTRNMHLHVQNFDEKPSFSLDLTQEFGEVAGSIDISKATVDLNMRMIQLDRKQSVEKQRELV